MTTETHSLLSWIRIPRLQFAENHLAIYPAGAQMDESLEPVMGFPFETNYPKVYPTKTHLFLKPSQVNQTYPNSQDPKHDLIRKTPGGQSVESRKRLGPGPGRSAPVATR